MDSGGALWSCHLSQGKRVGYRTVWEEEREEGTPKMESGRWGSRVEGESGEVSGLVGELDEGEGEGWQGGG